MDYLSLAMRWNNGSMRYSMILHPGVPRPSRYLDSATSAHFEMLRKVEARVVAPPSTVLDSDSAPYISPS